MRKHLDKLKPVMSLDDKKSMFTLSANCVRALEPSEVISSQNGGPYVFKTLLGWCLVGPMIKKKTSLVVIESCFHRLTQ